MSKPPKTYRRYSAIPLVTPIKVRDKSVARTATQNQSEVGDFA